MALTRLNPSVSDQLVVRQLSKGYTVAGSTNTSPLDFDFALAGHRCLGLVGVSTGHGLVVQQQSLFYADGLLRLYFRNLSSGPITSTAVVNVLYARL